MIKILTAEQMREVDRLSTERFGIPNLQLMENAGLAVVAALREACPNLGQRRIAIFCGRGNNGGDALVAARHLITSGLSLDIYLLAAKAELQGDARVQLESLDHRQAPIFEIPHLESWRPYAPRLSQYEIVVDGLLGTGLNKPVSGLYEEVIRAINQRRPLVLAIDIPSGLAADQADLLGEAIHADITVTFTAPKPALIFGEASQRIGRLIIAPIGSPDVLLARDDYFLNLITPEDVREAIPRRRHDSHKGTYGHVLVVAGSVGKTGAAAMTGLAGLRSGAGLVTIATPKSAQSMMSAHAFELMTEGLPETAQGTLSLQAENQLFDILKQCDVLAIGPGLGAHGETVQLVHQLIRKSPVPVVIDADGINAFESRLTALKSEKDQPLVLTPHPGEMARLLQKTAAEVQNQRVPLTRAFARDHGVIVVLKGFRTLIAAPDGAVYVCPKGNPGMATAGSGDVLTGIIASLFVNRVKGGGKDYPRAAAAAVYVHGLAGDLAAEEVSQEALIASDIIHHLPKAFKSLRIKQDKQDRQDRPD